MPPEGAVSLVSAGASGLGRTTAQVLHDRRARVLVLDLPGRVLHKDEPMALADFSRVIDVNLIGTFNVIRLAAATIAGMELVDGGRGVIVDTASIAALVIHVVENEMLNGEVIRLDSALRMAPR